MEANAGNEDFINILLSLTWQIMIGGIYYICGLIKT